MLNMINNIIFDWSGVVNDNAKIVYGFTQYLLKKKGLRGITFKEFQRQWKQPLMLFYNQYLPSLTLEEEAEEYWDWISKRQADPYSDLPVVIKYFKKRGFKLFLVSSDFKQTVLRDIKNFGLEHVFEKVYTEVIDKNQSVQDIIKNGKLVPSETLIVGDSNHEIEAGKNAGIKTAVVTWGFTAEDVLEKEKPDFIVHNTKELQEIINLDHDSNS